MPIWGVSEPYISLWLSDEPLGYQPAIGSRISFNLAYKQREETAGTDANIFSAGKGWNFSWFSYATQDGLSNNIVHLPGGTETIFFTQTNYLTETRITGDTTNGFTIWYPDGSKSVYGFMIYDYNGHYERAYLTEQWNRQGQKTAFHYDSYTPTVFIDTPVIRLLTVVDGNNGTNTLYYNPTNSYSTNLIDHVVDAFGRTTFLAYDTNGCLTNIMDVQGLSSSIAYDTNVWPTSLTTPYGTTSFILKDGPIAAGPPNGRSARITDPTGGHHLFLYTNNASGIASSYATNQLPNTTPYTNTFDNSDLAVRNSFHWGPRQYDALSTTNIGSLTSADFKKARMRHWLASGTAAYSPTLSMQRKPSPESSGASEGQKVWYDYTGKTNTEYEGTQILPLFTGWVLPDGTTAFSRSERNNLGHLTAVVSTYSEGSAILLRTNAFVYTNEVDLVCMTNALGVQVVSNVFNTYHQVTTNYDALGQATVYTYDANHHLTSTTHPNGLVSTNFYGTNNFLAQQIVVGISTNCFGWSNALVVVQTNTLGLIVSNSWDNLQRLTLRKFPDGTTYTNTWAKLDLVQTVDRLHRTNSFGYDEMRRLIGVTNALRYRTEFNYCSCGALESTVDALNNTNFFYYDNVAHLTNVVGPDGYGVTNYYDLADRLTNTVDSAKSSVTNYYANEGLLIAQSNAFGRVLTVAYDILDRATNTVDVNGLSLNATYDDLNRLRTRSYPDGGIEGFGYTANIYGLTSYTNALNQFTHLGYDSAMRKSAETNANLEVTRFGYNGANELLTLTDGNNHTTTWVYDQYGRVTNKFDAASTLLFIYKYDAESQLTNRYSNAKGATVYQYDLTGNVTNISYPVNPAISFAYDAMSRPTNMTDGIGTTRYSYNAIGQVLSEDGPWSSDTLTYTYTQRQRSTLSLAQPVDPAWSQTYSYDVAKRLTNLTSAAGSFTYTFGGTSSGSPLIKNLLLPNGAYVTNTYDNMLHLTGTYLKNSGGTNLNFHQYGYNLGSQRTTLTNFAGNYLNYTYDSIGQLKTALGKESGGTSRLHEQLGYAYDAAGNLQYRTNNTLLQNFQVNAVNELTAATNGGKLTVVGTTTIIASSVTVNGTNAQLYGDTTFAATNMPLAGSYTATAHDSYGRVDTNTVTVNLSTNVSYSYDGNGNLLSDGLRAFAYDDENQLVQVLMTNQWKKAFSYDGLHRMKIKQDYVWSGSAWVQTNETSFIYDGPVVLQHRDSNNVPTLTLTRSGGVGGLLAMTEGNGTNSYYHSDGNGNVACLIDTNQLAVARASYDSFGNTLAMTGPKAAVNRYWFSSQYYDADSGFYHYLYRAYDPNLQRWINRDPIGELGGINLFEFVENNSNDRIDQNGNSFTTVEIIVAGVVVLIVVDVAINAYQAWTGSSHAINSGNQARKLDTMGQYQQATDVRNQAIQTLPDTANAISSVAGAIADGPKEAVELPAAVTGLSINNWPEKNQDQNIINPLPGKNPIINPDKPHVYVDKCGKVRFIGTGTPPPGLKMIE